LLALAGASATSSNQSQPPEQFANCWQDLAAEDAGLAYRAAWLLVQNPDQAVKLLRQHLTPAPAPDLAQIQTWLADLESQKYAVRVKAVQELEKQGELAEALLRKVLDGNPALETRQRAQMLLDRLQKPLSSPEKLRTVRAVEVLEMVGTAEAKELLQQLATGFAQHRLTQEAQDSLKRLQERANERRGLSPPGPPRLGGGQPAADPKPGGGPDGDPLPFGARTRLGTTLFRQAGSGPIRDNGVAFSSDSRLVAAIGRKTVYLWEAQTGKLHRKLDYSASSLALSRKGTLLALALTGAAAQGYDIVLWDCRQEKELARIAMPPEPRLAMSLAFSPDGSQLLAANRSDSSMILRAWDTTSLKETTLWKAANPQDRLVGFSTDGSRVVVGRPSSGTSFILNLQKDARVPLQGWDRNSPVLAFSPDAQYLASGSFDGLRIWDAATGKLWRVLADDSGRNVSSLAFSTDAKILAATDYSKGIFLWDLPTGKYLNQLAASENFRVGAISPDSRWLAAVRGSSLRVWNLETGQAVNDGDGHVETIRSLAISPRLDAIATGGNDGTLRLWDAVTGKQKHLLLKATDALTFVSGVAFSSDGKWLASSDLGDSVRLWEVATGRQVYKLPGHGPTGGRRVVQFSPDGRYLLSWGDDYYLRKWDMKTGKVVLEHRTRPSGFDLPEDDDGQTDDRRQRALEQKLFFVADCAFTHAGDQFVLPTRQGNLHFFDVATGKETRVVKTSSNNVNSLAISPTGKHLVLSGYDGRSGFGFSMTVAELASGKVVFNLAFPGPGYGQAEFSPDGRTVAAVYGDKLVVVELATGKTRLSVDNLPAQSRLLTFSRDGRFLVTAMDDTTALVWDLAALGGRTKP